MKYVYTDCVRWDDNKTKYVNEKTRAEQFIVRLWSVMKAQREFHRVLGTISTQYVINSISIVSLLTFARFTAVPKSAFLFDTVKLFCVIRCAVFPSFLRCIYQHTFPSSCQDLVSYALLQLKRVIFFMNYLKISTTNSIYPFALVIFF